MITPELKAVLDQRNVEMETTFSLHLGEQDLCDLGAGYVSNTIKAMARNLLDWHDEEVRKMAAREAEQARTARKPKRKKDAA